jgi:hypothetical protein
VNARATERLRREWDQPLGIRNKRKKRVWTAKQNGSGLVDDEWTDLSRGANYDDIASNVRRRGEKITIIVNIYDQKDLRSEEGERPA